MAGLDRRKKLTLDEVNIYWRKLTDGLDRPDLHKLCNAVRTLDLALTDAGPALCRKLSAKRWSRIRNDCFDYLISSFPGHFIVYGANASPIEGGAEWPTTGLFEFYPEMVKRREDSYQAPLNQIDPNVVVRFMWAFAEGRHDTTAQDFLSFRDGMNQAPDQEDSDRTVVDEVYEACADEASKLKKLAHRQWWQLHYEAKDCADRRHKIELRRQMENLELLWGKSPAH